MMAQMRNKYCLHQAGGSVDVECWDSCLSMSQLDKEHKEKKAVQDIASVFGLNNQIDAIKEDRGDGEAVLEREKSKFQFQTR